MSIPTSSLPISRFETIQQSVNIFFMRHGQSIANKSNTVQGRANSALSKEGRTQARISSNYFKPFNLDGIYSSPLIRANETAKIVSKELGHDPEAVEAIEELQELDTGIFSERSIDSLKIEEPKLWNDYQRLSWDGVPEAEGAASLRIRSDRIWEKVAELVQEGKSSILCVAHGGIMQWIVKASFTPEGRWMPLLQINNCGIFHLHVRPTDAKESVIATWRAFNRIEYEE